MEWSKLQDEKELFIRDMILSNSISAAFQHVKGGVYTKEVTAKQKEEFRKKIEKYLVGVEKEYHQTSDKNHCERIRDFIKNTADDVALKNGELSFGVAQKLVNLYLKYLWCMDKLGTPPHCPIDRFVIDNGCQHPHLYHPWTQMTQEKYVDAMNEIKQTAGNESLAVWELNLWNDGTSVDKPGRKKLEKYLQLK